MKLNRRNFLLASAIFGGSAMYKSLPAWATNDKKEPDWPLEKEFGQDQAKRFRALYFKNENPLGPSPLIQKEVQRWVNDVEFWRYDVSDFYVDHLKKMIAEKENIEESQIFLGAGSRAVIAAALMGLKAKGVTRLVMMYPDYVDVAQYGDRLGFKVVRLPFSKGSYEFPLSALARLDNKNTVFYFSSPQLPIGTTITGDELKIFLTKLKSSMVIVDEAYIEFLDDFRNKSAVKLISDHSNLIVVRTFSKLYALAGMRIGYGMAAAPVKSSIFFDHPRYRIINPLAASGAAISLNDEQHHDKSRAFCRKVMTILAGQAAKEKEPLRFRASPANYYLVEVPFGPKNSRLKNGKERSKAWKSFKFDYWPSEAHNAFQTTLGLRPTEEESLADFNRLVEIMSRVGLV
jgi:histidinol-phosphate aminotransferase